MKYIETDNIDSLPGIRLKADDRFCFHCHDGLGCFKRCCHNLNLFLYPYDILQLKNCLQLTSDQFLEAYVDIVLREGNFFPEVLLKMKPDKGMPCPFIADTGCRVYQFRPHACRLFPVEQGLFYDAQKKQTELIHLFRPPGFCQGQYEKKEWTPRQWSMNQESNRYNKMTHQWAEIKLLFQNDPWGGEGPDGSKSKMSFMAAYNIDQFRNFVFHSSFLKRYRLKPALKSRIRSNDTPLLNFGMSWIKYYLWGIKSTDFSIR